MSAAAPSNAAPADLIELGRITAAYGIKGWVKVQPHSAQAEVLLTASEWWLTRPVPESARALSRLGRSHTRSCNPFPGRHGRGAVGGHCRSRSGRSLARIFRAGLARSFPAPEEDEYYWVDLIGCALYTNANGEPALIGVVDEVFDNGAHAVLKVLCQREGADGPEAILNAKGKPADMLVPFVRAHILSVDLAARRIDSDWPLDL